MSTTIKPPDFIKYWQPFRQDTKRFHEVFSFHQDYNKLIENTEKLSYLVRSYTVFQMTCAALGHPGGSFSEAETISLLFNYVLRYDPKNPNWKNRDVFYLSKCHACPSLYSLLALCGYFDIKDLSQYGSWGSHLESHPDSTRTPGIEISGGSLGQIPGVAAGRALGLLRRGPDDASRMVYCLVGDGECNEGSVWEAFMFAGHNKLDNLVYLIDYNKVQAKGFLKDDLTIEPLEAKLQAFNFNTFVVKNAHNLSELVDLFNILYTQRRGKPTAIILNTVKGEKVECCQYNPNWHTSAPRNKQTAQEWIYEIWQRDGKRLGIPESFAKELGEAIQIVPPIHSNPDPITEKQA